MTGGHLGRRLRLGGVAGALAMVASAAAGCSANVDALTGSSPGEERVSRVVDGDTVELSRSGRARLIGVDTPEVYGGVECFGREASAFAERELAGQTVRIRPGVQERDRYGRLLVYLYVDGDMFNEVLVRRGYASALTVPPNVEHADTFVKLAREARRRNAGLWSQCGD
jgi:micrococcal nuclease